MPRPHDLYVAEFSWSAEQFTSNPWLTIHHIKYCRGDDIFAHSGMFLAEAEADPGNVSSGIFI